MAKTNLKTKETNASVEDFLNGISDAEKRDDAFAVCEMMKRSSGDTPKMWGSSIVGFGSTFLKYASGRELDWMRIGFSPRKASLTLYLTDGIARHPELLEKLGKHKTGVGCLYIKALSDIDLEVLEKLITASLNNVK
ncbi:MAG TPA: DUF1801 domain-containing protein [Pyrinomonadaceae bacterium]|nr:DUF1801 domain-containing protein [Pyrinomonadaceae bacterium]